ncbi:MAG: glutamate racemase [Sphingobacteriaceae bacterium]|nr:glutamate racemase [Sphingobacteriaceae bacterium]
MVLKKELHKGPGPIGIFDSGYGGLTILKEISKQLPQYDYLYLGDNARAPYGTRSFETVYQYTLECVNHLFDKGCHLVILACNTASAKALRNIQQKDLPNIDPNRRVLGVIRPTTELAGMLTKTKHIGVLGTTGTVVSNSYPIEIHKFHPDVKVFQEACPMWVPLIENNEFNNEGSNYFIEKNVKALLKQSDKIDTIILGCTHYPLLENKLRQYIPQHIQLVSQGDIVAKGLIDYLKRHPEIESKCIKTGKLEFYTTETPENFSSQAGKFFGKEIVAKHLAL